MNRTTVLFALGLLMLSISSCSVEEVTFDGLNDVRITKIQNNELHLDVSVSLDNPNSFGIKVQSADLDVYLENSYIGKADLGESFTIKSGGKNDYDLSIITVGDNMNASLLPVLLSAALKGNVETRLKGSIKGKAMMVSKRVPIDITETVEFKNDAQ